MLGYAWHFAWKYILWTGVLWQWQHLIIRQHWVLHLDYLLLSTTWQLSISSRYSGHLVVYIWSSFTSMFYMTPDHPFFSYIRAIMQRPYLATMKFYVLIQWLLMGLWIEEILIRRLEEWVRPSRTMLVLSTYDQIWLKHMLIWLQLIKTGKTVTNILIFASWNQLITMKHSYCSGHVEAAIKSYKQALLLRADFPEATCNLLHTLQVWVKVIYCWGLVKYLAAKCTLNSSRSNKLFLLCLMDVVNTLSRTMLKTMCSLVVFYSLSQISNTMEV